MHSTPATVKTRVTYLEMKSAPMIDLSDPPGITVMRAEAITVSFYRYLYHAVGHDVGWADRKALTDKELMDIIGHEMVSIYVLYARGVPAGFVELDGRESPSIEIKYFGLMPEFRGRGLGSYFLKWTIRQAWTCNPRRLWLHTNDRDHPNALRNYIQNGFSVFDERIEDQLIMD